MWHAWELKLELAAELAAICLWNFFLATDIENEGERESEKRYSKGQRRQQQMFIITQPMPNPNPAQRNPFQPCPISPALHHFLLIFTIAFCFCRFLRLRLPCFLPPSKRYLHSIECLQLLQNFAPHLQFMHNKQIKKYYCPRKTA